MFFSHDFFLKVRGFIVQTSKKLSDPSTSFAGIPGPETPVLVACVASACSQTPGKLANENTDWACSKRNQLKTHQASRHSNKGHRKRFLLRIRLRILQSKMVWGFLMICQWSTENKVRTTPPEHFWLQIREQQTPETVKEIFRIQFPWCTD